MAEITDEQREYSDRFKAALAAGPEALVRWYAGDNLRLSSLLVDAVGDAMDARMERDRYKAELAECKRLAREAGLEL